MGALLFFPWIWTQQHKMGLLAATVGPQGEWMLSKSPHNEDAEETARTTVPELPHLTAGYMHQSP